MILVPGNKPMDEIDQLERAITALEAQSSVLGKTVVETALKPLREERAALQRYGHSAGEQRKLVTILFADLAGFTALSARRELLEMYRKLKGESL
jgi:class 3 adenylate cyclase